MVVKMDRVPPRPVKDPPNLIRSGAFSLDRLLSHIDQGRRRNPKSSSAASMSSATLTSPPIATTRLVVDTDVASFIFKWHPEFAPRYVGIMLGSQLIVSFMTLAEMCQGALDANWGAPQMRRTGGLSRA
jgi:hypothetical protein